MKRVSRAQAIRQFHALGLQVLKKDESAGVRLAGGYRRHSIAMVRERSGDKWSHSFLHTARLFAEAYPAETELKWFLGLGKKPGKPLTRSHAIRLTSVRDREDRDQLAERCAEESWTVRRLIEETQRVRGKVTSGGRRPRRPRDGEHAVLELHTMAQRWEIWVEQLDPEAPNGKGGGATLKDLPDNVGTLLAKTRKPVAALGKAIREHLEASAEKKAKDAAGKRRTSVLRRPSRRVP